MKLATPSMLCLGCSYDLGRLLTCNWPVHAFNSVLPRSIIWGKHVPAVILGMGVYKILACTGFKFAFSCRADVGPSSVEIK